MCEIETVCDITESKTKSKDCNFITKRHIERILDRL